MNSGERDPGDGRRESPTGRVPQWVRDEEAARLAARLGFDPAAGGGAGAGRKGSRRVGRSRHSRAFSGSRLSRGPRRRRRSFLPALFLVLAVALIGSYYAFPGLLAYATTAIAGEKFHAPAAGIGLTSGYPPRGVEAGKQPLGQPAALAQESDSYVFIKGNSKNNFVAYDPCRPIHFVTRPDNAPAGGRDLITQAVEAASNATGLVFIDDGGTSEGYTQDRDLYQPDSYGRRWAPVLFVWATQDEEPRFTAGGEPGVKVLAGLGGSRAIVGDSGSQVFVTGEVQLNAQALAETMTWPNGPALVGGVIQHEIGHVLGLGHVQDPSQLMNEDGHEGIFSYAAGDLAGLAKLGSGKCFANH